PTLFRSRAEVAVVVRPDLVALAIRGGDLAQHRERAALVLEREADIGAARVVARRPVEVAPAPVEQVDAADEEREVRVGLARDRAPVLPQPRPARAVERDDDELRRPATARRRGARR